MTFDLMSFDDNYRCEILIETKSRQLGRIDIKIPHEIETTDELEVFKTFYKIIYFKKIDRGRIPD